MNNPFISGIKDSASQYFAPLRNKKTAIPIVLASLLAAGTMTYFKPPSNNSDHQSQPKEPSINEDFQKTIHKKEN